MQPTVTWCNASPEGSEKGLVPRDVLVTSDVEIRVAVLEERAEPVDELPRRRRITENSGTWPNTRRSRAFRGGREIVGQPVCHVLVDRLVDDMREREVHTVEVEAVAVGRSRKPPPGAGVDLERRCPAHEVGERLLVALALPAQVRVVIAGDRRHS